MSAVKCVAKDSVETSWSRHSSPKRGAAACLWPSLHGGGRATAIKTGLLYCLRQPLEQKEDGPVCVCVCACAVFFPFVCLFVFLQRAFRGLAPLF